MAGLDKSYESTDIEQLFTRRLNENLPLTTLGDGETLKISQPFSAPPGASLKVIETGVSDSSGNTYANLTLEVYDMDGSSILDSWNSDYTFGTPASSIDVGGKTIVVRVQNTTGSTYDVGAVFNASLVV